MNWLSYAFVSAGAAALTAILAKLGLEGIPSTLATAIRTLVVVAVAWMLVVATNEHRSIGLVSRRSLIYLLLSGVATAVSWLAYFRALQLGPASRVAPIDKLSLPLTGIACRALAGRAGRMAHRSRRRADDARGLDDPSIALAAVGRKIGRGLH